MQAHRPVLDPALLQEGHLVNAGVQQRAPVLPEPAFRVALAAEGLLRHITGACRGTVRLLEPPGPHHVPSTSAAEPSRAPSAVIARRPGPSRTGAGHCDMTGMSYAAGFTAERPERRAPTC